MYVTLYVLKDKVSILLRVFFIQINSIIMTHRAGTFFVSGVEKKPNDFHKM